MSRYLGSRDGIKLDACNRVSGLSGIVRADTSDPVQGQGNRGPWPIDRLARTMLLNPVHDLSARDDRPPRLESAPRSCEHCGFPWPRSREIRMNNSPDSLLDTSVVRLASRRDIDFCALYLAATILVGFSISPAFAQSAPLGVIGLLALNSSDAHATTTQVEVPDAGGGGAGGMHGLRGGDGPAGPPDRSATIIEPAAVPPIGGDPGMPAAATPKHPSYRWQSLVPGAIK